MGMVKIYKDHKRKKEAGELNVVKYKLKPENLNKPISKEHETLLRREGELEESIKIRSEDNQKVKAPKPSKTIVKGSFNDNGNSKRTYGVDSVNINKSKPKKGKKDKK